MQIKTIIWDWNGTLLNDAPLCSTLINTMLTNHGYAPVGDINAYKNVFGFPIEEYYKRAGFDLARHPFNLLAEKYVALYDPASFLCPLHSGARETLQTLREEGFAQMILSASPISQLTALLDHFKLDSFFNEVLGLGDIHAKSKVEVGQAWLQNSGEAPDSLLMIGDSVHDFEVASALGAKCVLFSGGHQPRATLAATGARVIDELWELVPIAKSF